MADCAYCGDTFPTQQMVGMAPFGKIGVWICRVCFDLAAFELQETAALGCAACEFASGLMKAARDGQDHFDATGEPVAIAVGASDLEHMAGCRHA